MGSAAVACGLLVEGLQLQLSWIPKGEMGPQLLAHSSATGLHWSPWESHLVSPKPLLECESGLALPCLLGRHPKDSV